MIEHGNANQKDSANQQSYIPENAKPNEQKTERDDFEVSVSVIMPTYNRPDMLVTAVRSVLAQTFRSFEIIVVNDCGMDVGGILMGLDTENRITYVRHGKNRGLGAARNTGIRLARGKYIAYLDDDDVFYPNHLETLVSYLKVTGGDVAYSDAHQAHQVMEHQAYVTKSRRVLYSFDFDYDRILYENFIPVLCIVHKKECIDKVGFFDETLHTHEDWELWIRMSRRYRFEHVKMVTSEFTTRGDGSQMTSSRINSFVETTKRIYETHKALVATRPDLQTQQQRTLEARVRWGTGSAVAELSSLKTFMDEVIHLVEQSDIAKALALYDQQRPGFHTDDPSLAKFDVLIGSIRSKVQASKV